MFPNDKNNKSKINIKNIMFKMVYYILIINLFAYFFYCIGKVPPNNYVSKNTLLNNISLSTSVGNFNSNDIPEDSIDPYEDELNTFITSAFNTRNDGFLSGKVSKLYDYYGTSSANGKYSLNYEFKRISYLRDWALERAIIFTSINSLVIINKIIRNDDKIIVYLDEHYTFNYIHNKQFAINKFTLTIPHILTLYTTNDNSKNYFYIDKDYYSDIFNDDLDEYIFTLSETFLPYTKRINPNYEISGTYKKDDIIRFDKSFFTDHKAIISGFDSNGYPLIDSNLFNISNMPFDLGWKEKNIKPSY
ncbi:hypothetical protein [Clostridium sp.]|uniref:hypothetical protein n=1 Tax=Clostridium sp. TaxID=1506 RepID=UPI001B561C55|nr:hypothetical protein [Clostridium sp.]MBP3917355.1 hypothetical protein [Clostridium sp.]